MSTPEVSPGSAPDAGTANPAASPAAATAASTPPAAPTPPAAQTPAPPALSPQGLSPERLDQVISTTKPRGWISLVAVVAIVIATLIWSIVANLPQQTSVLGVISALAYSRDIAATADGVIVATSALTPGGMVKEGEVVATITPFDGGPVVDVKAPATGSITSIGQDNGAGVKVGDSVAVVQLPPDPSKGIVVVTFMSSADAITFTPGETASVSITNLAQSVTTQAEATVVTVSSSPATEQSMMVQAGSTGTMAAWMKQAGGSAYRVVLTISSQANIPPKLVPQAGQTVQIVNTFGTIHPIELLFGAK